jgi:hypothetical protein
MAGLAEAVQGVVGQPASVRVGVVDSTTPLAISAQGVPFDDVGLLGDYAPFVGDSVVLLGQCSGAGSDPASWLALGAARPDTAGSPISRRAFVATQETTSSAVYVNLATICGIDFVAPRSGRVMLHYRSSLTCAGGSLTFSAPQVAEGATVGSGSVVFSAADDYAMQQSFGTTLSFSASTLIEDLTPFAAYNVVLMVRSSVGGISVIASRREIDVVPAP